MDYLKLACEAAGLALFMAFIVYGSAGLSAIAVMGRLGQ